MDMLLAAEAVVRPVTTTTATTIGRLGDTGVLSVLIQATRETEDRDGTATDELHCDYGQWHGQRN